MPVDYLHISILSNEFRIEYLIDFQFKKTKRIGSSILKILKIDVVLSFVEEE